MSETAPANKTLLRPIVGVLDVPRCALTPVSSAEGREKRLRIAAAPEAIDGALKRPG